MQNASIDLLMERNRQGVKEFKASRCEVDVLVLHGFHVEAHLDSHFHATVLPVPFNALEHE